MLFAKQYLSSQNDFSYTVTKETAAGLDGIFYDSDVSKDVNTRPIEQYACSTMAHKLYPMQGLLRLTTLVMCILSVGIAVTLTSKSNENSMDSCKYVPRLTK